jgi:hypothetical protein
MSQNRTEPETQAFREELLDCQESMASSILYFNKLARGINSDLSNLDGDAGSRTALYSQIQGMIGRSAIMSRTMEKLRELIGDYYDDSNEVRLCGQSQDPEGSMVEIKGETPDT